MADIQYFRFLKLAPRNQIGATVIAIASLAERVALRALNAPDDQRSFADWKAVLAFIDHRTTPIKAGGTTRNRSDWFDPGQDIALKKGNERSAGASAEAISSVLGHYLRDDGPIRRCNPAPAGSDGIDLAFIGLAAEALDPLVTWANLLAVLNGLFNTGLPDRDKNAIVDRVVETLFGTGPFPPHPLLPAKPLFDPALVQSEFLPVRSPSESDTSVYGCDLYAVVREVRGWAADDPSQSNMLVRDLLWLRMTDKPESRQDIAAAKSNDPLIGLYLSAIDRTLYCVETIRRAGRNITLTARSVDNPANIRFINLVFTGRVSRTPLLIRDGILSACADDTETLGGWKCLIIRPDWPFFYQLRTLMHELTYRQAQDGGFYSLCESLGTVGIIHSKALLDQEHAAGTGESIRQRRDAFRHLLFESTANPGAGGDGVSQWLKDQISRKITDGLAATAGNDAASLTETATAALTSLLQENWRYVEPAQTISHPRKLARSEQIPEDDRARAALLTQLTQVVPQTQQD